MKKSANELSLDNVGGIFVVLLAGMGIACSIAVLGTNSQINYKASFFFCGVA